MSTTHRQSIHSIHNKKFWTEFFYLYESLPALWDMNNPLYKNRQVKCDAYDIMVDKLREIEPNADREDVLRKINIFRTNYRRECSRINTSLQEGKHYQSTLWYFDLLCFLQTTDTRRDRKRKLDDDGEKSIMRKRRGNNIMHNSSDQFMITPKKEHLIEYPTHSTHEFEYDLDEDPDYDYVPDELAHTLVESKSDSTSEIQQNPLDDEDEQSQQDYQRHQDEFQSYALQRNIQTNNNQKIQLTGEIITTETSLEMNDESQEQHEFQEYAADNENETMQTAQWCIKTTNAQNIASIQMQKPELHSATNCVNLNETKFVRDVKTMTSSNSQHCCSKLLESSEILAKSWAIQYGELSQDQKLLARKAISDILFEGCMGNLAIGSNGRVTIDGADYRNVKTKESSVNDDVESGEIYEQSTNVATPTKSGIGAGATGSVASTSKVHTADEWLKL
ncbi:uncharacterized protein LOC135955299 [Calliphora vicina]|uniref:uncharacterized protein LOC135955299 n=1 Tax=Calliphora vicina TaxID=7373 RepID=UPI00325C0644